MLISIVKCVALNVETYFQFVRRKTRPEIKTDTFKILQNIQLQRYHTGSHISNTTDIAQIDQGDQMNWSVINGIATLK